MKVCVITTSLGKGGAERSSAILTKMFTQLGCDVHVLITKNFIEYEFSGTLLNLEQECGQDSSNFNKVKILRSYFKKQQFDVIVDNRIRPTFLKEWILHHFIYKAKTKIFVVRSFNLKYYFPKSRFLANILYRKNVNLLAVSMIIKEEIHKVYGIKNVKQIYNPIDFDNVVSNSLKKINVNDNFIIWYGRIQENVKNLNLLLNAYKYSKLPENNIKLYVIGSGDDVDNLKERVFDLSLSDKVCHLPFLINPFPYVYRAKFLALTSYFEGFPRVLIESLSCGTPVVSVDCQSGPNEIIKHRYNGLLVENHNVEALANAFNAFLEDHPLYEYCKANAKQSIGDFTMKNIASKWKALLDI